MDSRGMTQQLINRLANDRGFTVFRQEDKSTFVIRVDGVRDEFLVTVSTVLAKPPDELLYPEQEPTLTFLSDKEKLAQSTGAKSEPPTAKQQQIESGMKVTK